jgi:hypothetical protein
VHDAPAVQVGQRVGDLCHHVGRHPGRQRAAGPQPVLEVWTVDQIQHQRVGAVRRHQVARPHYRRMVQLREELRLRQEPVDQIRLDGRLRPQQLHRDPFAGRRVQRPPHDADGTLGDLRLQLVPALADIPDPVNSPHDTKLGAIRTAHGRRKVHWHEAGRPRHSLLRSSQSSG